MFHVAHAVRPIDIITAGERATVLASRCGATFIIVIVVQLPGELGQAFAVGTASAALAILRRLIAWLRLIVLGLLAALPLLARLPRLCLLIPLLPRRAVSLAGRIVIIVIGLFVLICVLAILGFGISWSIARAVLSLLRVLCGSTLTLISILRIAFPVGGTLFAALVALRVILRLF